MTTKKSTTPGYSINIQHEYITIKTPFGNYTSSFSGEKLSGQICVIGKLIPRLKKYTDDFIKKEKNKNFGDAMESLMNNFSTVVPEILSFSNEVIEEGDIVSFKEDIFIKKYPGNHLIYKVKGKYAYIKIGESCIGFPPYSMKIVGKKVKK